ncbi:MAG: hypothetical protein WAK20_03575, partial [Candidatus Acidiferrum sp.]
MLTSRITGQMAVTGQKPKNATLACLVLCKGATPMKECEQFADDLWVVDGPNVRDFGIVFTTR